MNPFGWGVIGPGNIANKFAGAVAGIDNAQIISVQGRDATRASAFAQKWSQSGSVNSTTDIDTLLSDDRIAAIYIATPHPFHAAAIERCLAAGKPVLCEKPLVVNASHGRAVVELARKQNLFLMEAVWTRFLPVYGVVADWLSSGAIGRVRTIQSSFCFNIPFDPAHRAFDPAQAGGALLDLGIYNLTMTRWALHNAHGKCPPLQALHASAAIGATGVDNRLSALLDFGDGVTSQFVCGFDTSADNSLEIFARYSSHPKIAR
ncbi:MAG: Gfo/Idh/MocA family oxidoreductase, partial [Betaproteobacteria bacterium]